MLLLTMNIDKEVYGLDAQHVIEVIPLVLLQHIPCVDACIRGIFNYRGTPVPVVDLSIFFNHHPCRNNLGSRIIIIHIKMPDNTLKTVGLLAEHVTEVIKCNPKDFSSNGISADNAQFLKSIYQNENGMIQIIDITKILPASITQELNSQAFA
jgi:chemotaxis-related protein WspB